MQDDRLKYGTEFTSVKVHQSPGGNSSLSLAWEEPQRRRQGGRGGGDSGGRGQSWDNQPTQMERGPARNPGRAYPEPRPRAQAPSYPEPRAQPDPRGQPAQQLQQAYGGAYRGQQDPEPAFRADLPWREEAGALYQAGDQRRKQVDDPRYAPRPIPRPREAQYEEKVYVPRARQADPSTEERVYVPRPRPVEPVYADRVYVPRSRPTDYSHDSRPEEQYFGKGEQQYPAREEQYPGRAEAQYPGRAEAQYPGRAEAQYPGYSAKVESSQVHTSVKVREPPGGRTNFTFG